MNILDIAIAKQLAGGGGSGTDNYNELSNLPKINGTTLSGDKSSSSLGLQSEIKEGAELASDLVDDSESDNKFVTSAEKLEWSGKQNLIDSSHKLSSDLVNDADKTNKFVTASEKETWNGKQNLIDNSHKLSSDLVDDTNKTNKFVTSTEKNTWNAKQNAIDSDHKLSSSLVSFSTAEAAALASGINSSKVGQISTNQTNILYTLNRTGKNLLDTPSVTISGKSWNTDSDGYITASDTTGDSRALNYANCQYYCHLHSGTYKLVVDIKTASSSSSAIAAIYSKTGTISTNNLQNKTGVQVYEFTISTEDDYGVLTKLYAGSWRMMICEADMYAKDSSYVPYSLPNYDLTRLQSEDRAGLVDVVDSGAKNLLDYDAWKTVTISNGTAVWENNGVTLTSTGIDCYTNYTLSVFNAPISVKQGDTLVMSWDYEIASGIQAEAFILPNGGSTGAVYASITEKKLVYTVPSGVTKVTCRVGVRGSGNVAKYKNVMICTKAAFGVSNKFVPFGTDPFYQVPINHNMIYRGRNLGATLTDAQHTALSSGNFTDLYLGDYWTKTVTIPAGTYTGGDSGEVTVPAQTNITLKAVIADFDTFYAGYASSYAGIHTHHAAVIVTGFRNVVWNKTNSTAGGYVASLIHKWLVGSALPQIETWFGSAKVLSHQKSLTNAITGDAASGWAWSSQKISLLSENQMYGSKVWGNSKAANGGYEPGEAFKHLNVFNHIDANLLFGNRNIWLRDIASAVGAASLFSDGGAIRYDASNAWVAPAALILLS